MSIGALLLGLFILIALVGMALGGSSSRLTGDPDFDRDPDGRPEPPYEL